jgi:hypothetical protein
VVEGEDDSECQGEDYEQRPEDQAPRFDEGGNGEEFSADRADGHLK